MFITPILYIILGISLGVGSALIFLQERFTKERRKLIALNEAEKAKSTDMLKSLDAKWEEKTRENKEKGVTDAAKIRELEEALATTEDQDYGNSDVLSPHANKKQAAEIIELQTTLQVKETELKNLLREKQAFGETLQSAQQEIEDLHGEAAFLKGEIKTLQEAKKKQPADDDFLVLGPGNHYIPGSVARNLMARRQK